MKKTILTGVIAAGMLLSSCRKDMTLKNSAPASLKGVGSTASVFSHTELKAFDYPPGSSNRLFIGVACGNFDGSGIATMALLKRASSQVIFMRSANDGAHYQIPFSFNVNSTLNDFKGIASGDMDGDGRDELMILRNGSAGVANILVYKIPLDFSGAVTLQAQLQVGGGTYDFRGLTAGDFDGDGKDEVTLAKVGNSQFIFYGLSGSSLVLKGQINLSNDVAQNDWRSIAAGDLDADGKDELVAVRYGSGTYNDILIYKVSSSWAISTAGDYNYAGGTSHYQWLGVAVGEFDQDRSNGKEFVLYKNSHSNFIYCKYNGAATAPSTLGANDYSSEIAWPWTGIAAGETLINTGGDQLVGVRQKTAGTTLAVFGDINTRFTNKKAAISRNNFSFGSYYQHLTRNANGTLDVAGLKTFLETNKVSNFAFMIADRWIDPATGLFHPKGTEYKSFIELLELLKSSGSPIKIMAFFVPPSESNVSSSYKPNPGDSPYIGSAELGGGITDERALFSGGASNPNPDDFPAWFKLVGILANKYPNLASIGIDDFTHNIVETGTSEAFNRIVLGKMMKNLREKNEDVAFLPTIYYSATLAAGNVWVREYTDGFTFYFRNEKYQNNTIIVPPDVTRSGTSWNMHGAIVLPSTDIAGGQNYINTEINDVYSWIANTNKLLIVGIYASTHSGSTTEPTPFTTDKIMNRAKLNANCDGVMIYVLQTPTSPVGQTVYAKFNSWW